MESGEVALRAGFGVFAVNWAGSLRGKFPRGWESDQAPGKAVDGDAPVWNTTGTFYLVDTINAISGVTGPSYNCLQV